MARTPFCSSNHGAVPPPRTASLLLTTLYRNVFPMNFAPRDDQLGERACRLVFIRERRQEFPLRHFERRSSGQFLNQLRAKNGGQGDINGMTSTDAAWSGSRADDATTPRPGSGPRTHAGPRAAG